MLHLLPSLNFMRIALLLFFILLLAGTLRLNAQQIPGEGFFTSEAAAVALGEDIIVSVKKYNPTAEEIANAIKLSKNAPMNYLQAPPEATNISMYSKSFESVIYCLDKAGNIKWNSTLGYSNKSPASPLVIYKGFLYAGESVKDGDNVLIQKMDSSGKIIWQTKLDSLNDVNAIYVDGDKVNALVSFEGSEKITQANGSYSYHNYPVYFFVQFNNETGKKLKQEYQMMGNYLSKQGFSNPVINTDYSYYLNNNDSAAFFNVANQQSATIVSKNMSKENTILKLTAGTESNHYITALAHSKNERVYTLISDFYGKKKQYQSELPVTFGKLSTRFFIYKNENDSLLTIINSGNDIDICYTDFEGKSSLYKKIKDATNPVIAAGIISGKVFLVQLNGRNKPGLPGQLKLSFY